MCSSYFRLWYYSYFNFLSTRSILAIYVENKSGDAAETNRRLKIPSSSWESQGRFKVNFCEASSSSWSDDYFWAYCNFRGLLCVFRLCNFIPHSWGVPYCVSGSLRMVTICIQSPICVSLLRGSCHRSNKYSERATLSSTLRCSGWKTRSGRTITSHDSRWGNYVRFVLVWVDDSQCLLAFSNDGNCFHWRRVYCHISAMPQLSCRYLSHLRS